MVCCRMRTLVENFSFAAGRLERAAGRSTLAGGAVSPLEEPPEQGTASLPNRAAVASRTRRCSTVRREPITGTSQPV
jgi:hypothetical protein